MMFDGISQNKSGFLLIHKPSGMRSYEVIHYIKKYFPRGYKIGHAGTLDSFASGLLIVGCGRSATRELHMITRLDKTYEAQGFCGLLTDTLDRTGNILKQESFFYKEEELRHVLDSFEKTYDQVPPIYSALKYNGRPLSFFARKEKKTLNELACIVKSKKRTVTVHDLSLTLCTVPLFSIKARVSCGTYIRSLVYDIGIRLGTYATTIELKRVSIGPFHLSEAVDPSCITTMKNLDMHLFTLDEICSRIKQTIK